MCNFIKAKHEPYGDTSTLSMLEQGNGLLCQFTNLVTYLMQTNIVLYYCSLISELNT